MSVSLGLQFIMARTIFACQSGELRETRSVIHGSFLVTFYLTAFMLSCKRMSKY